MTSDIEQFLEQAQSHVEAGSYDEARACLLEILKQDPDNQSTLIILGGEYFRAEMFSEAEMIFERLILNSPGKGQFSIALFNVLWKMGRHEEAFEEIKRFMAHADQNEEVETIQQYAAITENISDSLK